MNKMPDSKHLFHRLYWGVLLLSVIFVMNLPGVTVGEDKPQRRDRLVPVEVFQAETEDVV